MAEIHAVSKARHGNKRLLRSSSYRFAERDAVVRITIKEVGHILTALPLGFMKQDERYILVAIQGLTPETNVLVDQHGRWRGSYIPKAYTNYPFLLVEDDKGSDVLCVDESCDRLSEDSTGEPLFDNEGVPLPTVKELMVALSKYQQELRSTQEAADVLQRYSLIEPWTITIQEQGAQRKVEGLYRINERMLNALDGTALQAVRDANALVIAYGQLFSIQHIYNLGRQKDRQLGSVDLAKAGNTEEVAQNLGLIRDEDVISFDSLAEKDGRA